MSLWLEITRGRHTRACPFCDTLAETIVATSRRAATVALLGFPLIACTDRFRGSLEDSSTVDSSTEDGSTKDSSTETAGGADTSDHDWNPLNIRPFREAWTEVHRGPFPEGIDTISIGSSTPLFDNFANRGDVTVIFEQTDQITIEMRRFTMASTEERAHADFDLLSLWAFTGSAQRPNSIPVENDCTMGPWKNDCKIYVFYDGQQQNERTGADFRVTLPNSFRGSLNIESDDNDIDRSYHNRANVCIENLNANARVRLGNGLAFVTLAEDITPMPTCAPDLVAECENFQVDGQPAPWSADCPCFTGGVGAFGQAKVESHDGASPDIVLDMPPSLWAAINLTNSASIGSSGTCGPDTEVDGTCCATVDVPNFEPAGDPVRSQGVANYPGGAAILGAGYAVQLTAKECASVTYTSRPEDFVGRGGEQQVDVRGDVRVCSGCLREQSCDDLMP